jgi:hypothetical protein
MTLLFSRFYLGWLWFGNLNARNGQDAVGGCFQNPIRTGRGIVSQIVRNALSAENGSHTFSRGPRVQGGNVLPIVVEHEVALSECAPCDALQGVHGTGVIVHDCNDFLVRGQT